MPERDGILVRGVERGSAADRAGLERGDLIVTAGGRDLERIETLYEVLDGASEDGQLELRIIRGAEERTVSVSL
ncbi:MAG: PDZ domain-containing protein [Solirubrobacterales bacterium]|nr:PDZ domain-containing protein [Solirubrobacterales bacterium]